MAKNLELCTAKDIDWLDLSKKSEEVNDDDAS